MKQPLRCLLAILGSAIMCVSAYAQITTSSLSGRVTDKDGQPVVGAAVVATHVPSGTVYGVITNSDGRYTSNGMRSGGPYTVEVSCLGYQTVKYTEVNLQLGEVTSINASMADDSELLSEAIVISEATSKFAAEQTGAATNVSNSQITSLPTISRSITDIAKLSPYGGNGMSFAGKDGRTSNFTVDGANFNNNFGLDSNLPAGGSPISIEAIEEVQIVVSPYDVRQANFVGGGVNAITKSGTNTFKGSAYVYHRNENMRGNKAGDQEVSGARDKDRTTTYGATFGGPILKNKLFFFANFEYSMKPTVVNRWRGSENGVDDADNYISRVKNSELEQLSKYLKEEYGYDTGSWTNFPANESNMKVLGRIDWNITNNHHLAVRGNYTIDKSWTPPSGNSSDCGVRTTDNRMSKYGMSYANSMYSTDKIAATVSIDLNSRFTDKVSNQFLATYSILNNARGSNSKPFPFVDILDGTGRNPLRPYISFGYELFTWYNGVHNNVITIKDDVTAFLGKHKITGGVNYEYQLADNSYIRNGTGYYRYNSLEDFYNKATPETVNLNYGYDGNPTPAATVRYHKLAAYAQDEWNATDNFKLTYGVRLETILFDKRDVMRNNAIYEVDFNGKHIDTGIWPTAKLQASPRVGFSWDVLGDKSLKLRGGTGLFAGRIPLVFLTNMPNNSNMVQRKGVITTNNKGVADPLLAEFAGGLITNSKDLYEKMHALDPVKFPYSITPEDGVLGDKDAIQAVDPKFKMPQVWKTSLAIDYSFPVSFPFSITGEFIFNKTVNEVCLKDYNIKSPEGFLRLNGADNRHIYTGSTTYTNHSAYVLSNTNKGYSYTASVSLHMSPVKGLNIDAAYTHTMSKELTGMPGSDASSAFTSIPTIEGPNNAPLHNSSYVTPDRYYVSVSYRDKANNTFSLFYDAWRGGSNYTYMTSNDLNGDGYNYDVIYIPSAQQFDAIAADPTGNDLMRFTSEDNFKRFHDYVNRDKYLSKHKGEYSEAYSVYSPWVHRVDFHFAHDFKIRAGKQMNTIQVNFDIKNLLNLFNPKWGVSKYMNPDLNSGRILKYEGAAANGVPVYSAIPELTPDTEIWTRSTNIGQCWYAQVGIKYMFN